MNYFDIVLVIPLLWAAYKGYTKGLIISITSLLALLVGIYGAIRFSGFVGQWLDGFWSLEAQYLSLIAFALTFLAIVLSIHFLSKMLEKLVKAIALAWLNVVGGIVFNLLKAAFIMSVIIYVYEQIDLEKNILKSETRESSLLYSPISMVAPLVYPGIKDLDLKLDLPEFDKTEEGENNEKSQQNIPAYHI